MSARSDGTEPTDLDGPDRELGLPVVLDAYTGIYRWHAKRTLRTVDLVRAIREDRRAVAISMLAFLAPEVGYVYYLLVLGSHRGRGLGGALFDDALRIFRTGGRRVAYIATGEENAPMMRLIARRGFRSVSRTERGYHEGGLGAWGIRSRMTVVPGETLFGRRLDAPDDSQPPA